jgi:signal transduction histidine kinase/ActR/RegA family two-component response regulator
MARRVRPDDLTKPFERALGETLAPVLASAAMIMVVNAAFDAALLPPAVRWGVAASDLVTAVFCLLLRLSWKRWPAMHRFSDPIVATVGLLMALNAVTTIFETRDLLATAHVMLLVVCAGNVLKSPRWLVAFAATVLTGWALVAIETAPARPILANLFGLIAACVAAGVFYWMRVRAYAKIGLLRARDRVRGERLRAAFSTAKGELEQRKRIEAEGERLREQLLHAQKMDAVGRLAGGVAHDMNNVLTSITTIGELLLEDGRLDEVGRDDVGTILAAARRAAAITRNLLAFSRRGKYASDVLDAAGLVDGARHLLARTLPAEFELEVVLQDGGARVEGDANQLAEALVNLCLNAADAMPDGGVIRIRAGRVRLEGVDAHRRAIAPGEYLTISVQDSGAGMDSETRRLAFDPFFTTKPDANASGLGLPMVYGTARNHGGSVEIESRMGEGTTVTVHLPCAPVARGVESVAPPSGPRADLTQRRVLLVDDEPSVRASARRILERMGLRVHASENGRRALEAWTTEGPFDLVVVDMAMPVMGGKEFFFRLKRLAPEARVLVVSGFAGDREAAEALAAGALGFVEKPYTPTALSRAVRSALTRETPTAERELGS